MFVFVQSPGTALETAFSFIGYISLRHLRLEPSLPVPYCLLTGVGILIALWVDLAPCALRKIALCSSLCSHRLAALPGDLQMLNPRGPNEQTHECPLAPLMESF